MTATAVGVRLQALQRLEAAIAAAFLRCSQDLSSIDADEAAVDITIVPTVEYDCYALLSLTRKNAAVDLPTLSGDGLVRTATWNAEQRSAAEAPYRDTTTPLSAVTVSTITWS